MRSSLFINTKPPYSSQATKESLDAALASAAFGVDVGLLFIGDGVFQMKDGQNPAPQSHKRTGPIFQALELYEISNVYVCEEDLVERGLSSDDLMIQASIIPRSKIPTVLADFDHLLTF